MSESTWLQHLLADKRWPSKVILIIDVGSEGVGIDFNYHSNLGLIFNTK